MANRFSRITLVVFGLVVGWTARGWNIDSMSHSSVVDRSGPTIQQVQELATLVTTRVEVADVLETAINGLVGSEKVAILIKGDFLIGTDLSKAKFEQVDTLHHHAVLLLAPPVVTSPRLDHEHTRLYGTREEGLWRFTPDQGHATSFLIEQGYADAQRVVADAGSRPDMVAHASQQAEGVLTGFFKVLGWDVVIRWSGR